MVTAETLDNGISRRDFLLPFARHKRRHPKVIKPHSSLNQPKSPKSPLVLDRRQFLYLAGGTAAAIALAAGGINLWESSYQETLESLVTQAKKMEDEYKGIDLANKEARNQYSNTLADIFVRYYPLGISKQQLLSSIVWIDSKKEYEEIFVKRNQDPAFSHDYIRKLSAGTPAFTMLEDHKVYISTANDIFQKRVVAADKKIPPDWNPLKSLRQTLSHEFSHQISKPSQDQTIFSIVDPNNIYTDKEISGFQIKAFTTKKEHVGLFESIDEACVELLSKHLNTDLFQSFISEYGTEYGSDSVNNVSAIMTRLEQVLNAAGISRLELAHLHQTSDLKGFVLMLAERGGINPQKIAKPDRIMFGFSLFEALIQNNQAILQNYMNRARSINPTNSQK